MRGIKSSLFIILSLTLTFSACKKKKPHGPEAGETLDSSQSSDSMNGSSDGANGSVESYPLPDSEGAHGSSDGMSGSILNRLPIIYFDFEQSVLSSQSRIYLQEIATAMESAPGTRLSIEGHCDQRGSNEYNLALGDRRAQSVKRYLLRLGIANERLISSSFGEEKPISWDNNQAAWSKNRRVELSILR